MQDGNANRMRGDRVDCAKMILDDPRHTAAIEMKMQDREIHRTSARSSCSPGVVP